MTCDCDILKPKALCLTCANHICALFPKPCLLRKKFQSEGICLDYTKKTSLSSNEIILPDKYGPSEAQIKREVKKSLDTQKDTKKVET